MYIITQPENLFLRNDLLVHPELEKAYKKSTDADSYYFKKYTYLRDHDFFAEPKLADFKKLEESMVRNNIINIRQIVFETTNTCNLNCTYCALGEFYERNDERTGKKINTRYAVNLLKYILKLKQK